MRIFFTLVVSLSLAACGQGECVAPDAIVPRQDLAPPDTELSRDYLAGSWYLDQVRADRSTVRSLATLADDGTIEIEFLIVYEDGTRLAKTEYGYWGVSGDVYFTIIREASDGRQRYSVSPFDADYYLAYRILELGEESFRYQTIVTGNVFESRKVPKDFLREKGSNRF